MGSKVDLPSASRQAHAVLANALQESPPVNLSAVASRLADIRITLDDIERDGYTLDLGKLGFEIILSRRGSKARRRFSLAHELGHVVLFLAKPALSSRLRHDAPPIERWCNAFAAELLIPGEWVTRHFRATELSDPLEAIGLLSGRYEVSREAMKTRILELLPVAFGTLFFDGKHLERIRLLASKRLDVSSVEGAIRTAAGRGLERMSSAVPFSLEQDDMQLQFAPQPSSSPAHYWSVFVAAGLRPRP